ncbi:hypothetical protein MRB53_000083 [Persea americana]|uniref:Uncharacterized protein n=1 Tax=Persea americana TaxID=3435 RepID=A0ACC2MNS4_PERAE|nr:hypothetical protein MRB53_000083 [Persea americana]
MELLEEPLWTMYCYGRKSGFGVMREAIEDDLKVMELLMPVSMGVGHFHLVVGSRQSEALYMGGPNRNSGTEFTNIFFVRI